MKTETKPAHTPTSKFDLADALGWIEHAKEFDGTIDEGSPLMASYQYLSDHRAEILRAVNTHEELLKALKRIAYEPQGDSEASYRNVLEAVTEIAKQAIAKAEGRP